MKKTMPKEILYRKDSGRFVYGADADQVAFLLGGIGTGNISVGPRGELKDWEIFNWPGKNTTESSNPAGARHIRAAMDTCRAR